MASASAPNAPPPQQDSQKAPAPAPTHTLDNLQAMMNLVLVSSGRFIKAQQDADGNRLQFTVKRQIIAASERFHDSLDELENELLQAQTVLRRDLALMRADRKKREAAAKEKEAEKARLAAEDSAKKNVPIKQEEPPPAASPPKPQSPAADVKAEPAPEPAALNREMEDAPPVKTSTPVEEPPPETADDNANAQDTEFDFDALFGDSVMDTSGDGGDNAGDLSMDNMDTSGPDLNFTLDDSGPSNLLRGLEDFAKSGDDEVNAGQTDNNATMDLDFPMPDLPEMTATTASEQPSTSKPADDPATQQTTENDDLNIDTMPTDNLDDLFNLDYENPEDTQFNDAFFGFDDN